jgi:hypothetical protein
VWAKAKAFCLHSLTIAWSYVLALVGSVLQLLDSYADAFNDQSLKDSVHAVIGDTQTLSKVMLGISAVNIIARMRTLKKGP